MPYKRWIGLSIRPLLLVLYLLCISFTHSNSTILSGTGELTQGGWDFSLQMTVDPNISDIFIAIVVDPPLG